MASVSSSARPHIGRVDIWSTDRMPVDNSEASAASQKAGLVKRYNYVGSGQGTVVRITEFAPGAPKFMPRTETSVTRFCDSAVARMRSGARRRQDGAHEDGRCRCAALHAWVNNGAAPSVFAFILIDADRSPWPGKASRPSIRPRKLRIGRLYPASRSARGNPPDVPQIGQDRLLAVFEYCDQR
jgi:hypothetical protein